MTIVYSFTKFLAELQDYTFLVLNVFQGTSSSVNYRSDAIKEMYSIGAKAFLLVMLGGLFVGVIVAIETGHQLEKFGAKTLIGRTISLGMIREVGPIITGLLLAARTGAKNASEIGAMKLSEQIEALRAFGTNPIHKLVIPRIIAAQIMFLPLTLIADMTGIIGGMFVTKLTFNIDEAFFWNSAISTLEMKDLLVGFIKPFFFGFTIASISCYFGLSTKGGTTGLGKNTINAVVFSSVSVLIIDFIFTKVVWELL